MSLQGASLITELRQQSGLDHDFFDQHMQQILGAYRVNQDSLDLDLLRDILADYLQGLILAEETTNQTVNG